MREGREVREGRGGQRRGSFLSSVNTLQLDASTLTLNKNVNIDRHAWQTWILAVVRV